MMGTVWWRSSCDDSQESVLRGIPSLVPFSLHRSVGAGLRDRCRLAHLRYDWLGEARWPCR
eukprot:15411833-Alexandrium_andersonii.AAC.1